MNPIGRDQHIATCGHGLLRPVAPGECRGDTIRVLRHIAKLMPCINMVRADPRPCSLMEHTQKLATVYGKLRIVITGIETTRFTPEFLAESIGVDQLSGANSDAIERLKETEFSQFLDRVWERVNTDTEFT